MRLARCFQYEKRLRIQFHPAPHDSDGRGLLDDEPKLGQLLLVVVQHWWELGDTTQTCTQVKSVGALWSGSRWREWRIEFMTISITMTSEMQGTLPFKLPNQQASSMLDEYNFANKPCRCRAISAIIFALTQ